MRIIAKRTLQEFWIRHPATETPLKLWYYHVKSANWQCANDVIKQYPMARSVGNGRFIFKIKGNAYRLIVRINFDHQLVLIRFIGNHSAYDKIDAKTINMTIKPIHTEEDYQKALARVQEIFDAPLNTPEGDELEILSILIERFEDRNFPMLTSSPIDAIRWRMEQLNMKPIDLANIIGYKSRVSEIFSGKRKLSLSMIRKLNRHLHIPMDVLIQEY